MSEMTTAQKSVVAIVSAVVLAYLAFGVFVYAQGLQSKLSIHICPPGVFPEIQPAQGVDGSSQTVTQLPDCPTQSLHLADELRTAPVVIFGWLPLMIARMSMEPAGTQGKDMVTTFTSAGISEQTLPLPQNLPDGWYAHRITDTSFFITKQKVLPDIRAEGYAYGDQVWVSLATNTLTTDEWMAQRSGFDLNDTALFFSQVWTKSHGHPLLQVEHHTPALDQLTDFLFVGDRVYTISLYPYPGGEGLGIFNAFIDSYSADFGRRAISDADLTANCKKEVPASSDDSAIDLEIKIVTFYWWDDTLQDNVSLAVPYEPETGFAGCSESVKARLRQIQEMEQSGSVPR